jgi:hypothetical protein
MERSYFSIFAYIQQWDIPREAISLILTWKYNFYYKEHRMYHCDLCQSFNFARYEKNRILNADIKADSAVFWTAK